MKAITQKTVTRKEKESLCEYNSTYLHQAMADPEVRISGGGADEPGDVEMQGGDSADVMEVGETGADDAPGKEVAEDETAMEPAARVTFVE